MPDDPQLVDEPPQPDEHPPQPPEESVDANADVEPWGDGR